MPRRMCVVQYNIGMRVNIIRDAVRLSNGFSKFVREHRVITVVQYACHTSRYADRSITAT